ncbi:hypothetical protein FKM82_014273 [Ascaphus truei]
MSVVGFIQTSIINNVNCNEHIDKSVHNLLLIRKLRNLHCQLLGKCLIFLLLTPCKITMDSHATVLDMPVFLGGGGGEKCE